MWGPTLFPVTRMLSVTASQPGMAELDETYGGAAGKTSEQFVVVMLGIVQALLAPQGDCHAIAI